MLLTDHEIKAIIREAFRPLRCVVELLPDWLPDRQVRFRVIKQKRPTPIYTEPGIPVEVLRADSDLRELLRSVRRLLQKRGYRVHPW
jgi:hypothetical protein